MVVVMNFLKNITAVVFCLFSIGCSHTEIVRSYKPANLVLSDNTRLNFTMEMTVDKSKSGVTVYGEPYKLMVFIPFTRNKKNITLKEVSLTSASGTLKKLPDVFKYLGDVDPLYEGSIVLSIDVNQLEFQSYTLAGALVFEGDNRLDTHTFEVSLDTNYREEKINKFWEKLMGI
jgi:hypothetical protein